MTTSEERCIDRGQMNVLDAVGPMLDAWDSLSNDERGGISRDAPLFVQHLTKLRYLADCMCRGTSKFFPPSTTSGRATVPQNRSSAVMQQRHEALDSLDDFATPPWATRALFHHVLLARASSIFNMCSIGWEPACNRMYMARVMREFVSKVITSDVVDYGGNYISDFLISGTWPPSALYGDVHIVISNPPFVLAQEFIEIANTIRGIKIVAMLVRTSFLEGSGRYTEIYRDNPPTFVAQFAERVIMLKGVLRDPDKRFWDGQQWRRPSTATSYCWLVWVKGMEPLPFVHIPPCRKILTRPGDYPANPDEEGIFTPPQEGTQWHMDEGAAATPTIITTPESDASSARSLASTTTPSVATE